MARVAFVTGATGFMGRHLVHQLTHHGWRVRALVRRTSDTAHLRRDGVEIVYGDLLDPASLAGQTDGSDTVFHLAALTSARTEQEYEAANAGGTRAVVQAILGADRAPRRLVYLSSYAAVGSATERGPRSMEEPPAPLTAYGRTKLEGERIAGEAEDAGVELVVVRAPAVYGPGDRALLPFFRLVRWGLGPRPAGAERRLHLVFAPDLALALRRAADAEPGTYAVAEPVEHRWEEIVGVIGAILNRRPLALPLPPFIVRTAARVAESFGRVAGTSVPFNREKAEEMLALAWTCDLAGSEALLPPERATPLEVGIRETVRWYLRQGWL
jgi:dihydroflavonol-4-reductase